MTQPTLEHFGQVIHHGDPHPQHEFTEPGRCTVVGAGPGDPNLLADSAVKAIQAATLLLVDDLVNEAVLALATPGARVIHVGKRGGGLSSPPAFIDKLILMAVREGERVVHLKADKPLAASRGSEDTSPLQTARVSTTDVVAAGAGHTVCWH